MADKVSINAQDVPKEPAGKTIITCQGLTPEAFAQALDEIDSHSLELPGITDKNAALIRELLALCYFNAHPHKNGTPDKLPQEAGRDLREIIDRFCEYMKRTAPNVAALDSERSILLAFIGFIDGEAEPDSKNADDNVTQLAQELSKKYIPMLNGAPLNDLARATIKGAKPDRITKTVRIKTPTGNEIKIKHYDKLRAALSTPTKKILDIAAAYLAKNNYYGNGRIITINPTVEIPLKKYGELCGYDLEPHTMSTSAAQGKENKRAAEIEKKLKRDIRNNLHDVSNVVWTGTETKGRTKGDYIEMRIISSHSIRNGIIRINFDIDAAAFLVKSYIAQYPTALFKVDNRSPNTYQIGRKMAIHNGIDHNAAAGTNTTLAVKTLLAEAPAIPTFEEVQSGRHSWKDRIKAPLEKSLQDLIKIGFLKQWEYRNPQTQQTYTPEAAKDLRWPEYYALMIDFTPKEDIPDQTERRKKNAAEAATKKRSKEAAAQQK